MKKTIFILLILLSFSVASNVYAWRGHNTHQNKHSYENHKTYRYKKNHNHRHNLHNYSHRLNRRVPRYFHKYRHRHNHYNLHYYRKQNRNHYYKHQSTYPTIRYRSYTSDKYEGQSDRPGTVRNKMGGSPIKQGRAIPESVINHENTQRPENHVAVSEVWIPAKEERTWVPGFWSYGIRKTWRGDHWHYETNPNDKKWVNGHFEIKVVDPGHFEIR